MSWLFALVFSAHAARLHARDCDGYFVKMHTGRMHYLGALANPRPLSAPGTEVHLADVLKMLLADAPVNVRRRHYAIVGETEQVDHVAFKIRKRGGPLFEMNWSAKGQPTLAVTLPKFDEFTGPTGLQVRRSRQGFEARLGGDTSIFMQSFPARRHDYEKRFGITFGFSALGALISLELHSVEPQYGAPPRIRITKLKVVP